LDGEFFAGHEGFACVSGTVRRKRVVEKDWKHVKFMAFDILHPDCLPRPYSVRYDWLKKIVAESRRRGGHHLQLVEQLPITSMKQAYDYYQKVLRSGGEGLVIRDPKATYEQRRSRTLLKWKPIPEQEAVVVGFSEGKGRFKGVLGAFKAQMIDDRTKKPLPGKTFQLAGKITAEFRSQYRFGPGGKLVSEPSNQSQNQSQYPRLGDIVTYQYMSLTNTGLPRQPIFLRLRQRKQASR
jgi:DNA ligase-1